MKKYFSLVVLQLCLTFAQAWFETCNKNYTIPTTSTTYIVSNNYPSNYPVGDSCKYYLVTDPGYTIKLDCQISITAGSSDCSSQRLYISREGDKALNYADYFCGAQTVSRTSVGNEISLGYTSNVGGNGYIYCTANTIKTDQKNCQCGWNKNGRIVGGSYALPNEYVSMAALIDAADKSPNPIFCGAAIITEYAALTAAHCFPDTLLVSNVGVLVGDHDITLGTDTPYAALYKAKKIIKHASYNPALDNPTNDIALVQTFDDIKWKRTIGPACLPYGYLRNAYFVGVDITVLGWGMTSFGGQKSNILKKAPLTVIPSFNCTSAYGSQAASQMCTYTKGLDSCQSDSGGNLYYTYNGLQYTIAIVSYGDACGGPSPSVNTRVDSFIDWIVAQLPNAFFCQK